MPSLSISPASPVSYSTITVSGTGFAADKTRLLLAGAVVSASFRPASNGTFSVGVSLGSQTGVQILSAQQTTVKNIWSIVATLSITISTGTPSDPYPTITVGPASSATTTNATITWTTSETTTARVEYGTTLAYGTFTAEDTTLATSHSQTLGTTNLLSPGTTYYYVCHSKDSAGQEVISSNQQFATSTASLVISNVLVSSLTETSVTISWDVSAGATGQVAYGTTTAYGSLSTKENSFTYTHHIQNITGLSAATVYNYSCMSTDATGRSATSPNAQFKTSGSRPWALPVTTGTVAVTGIDGTGATDVTAAIQAFIDAVPDGRIIQFPSGQTYKISSCINPKGRNNLIIDGGGSILNNVAAANGFAEKGYTASFFWTRWNEVAPSHITIRNFVATAASPSPGVFQVAEQAAFWYAMRGTYLELANITVSGLFGDLMTLNENPSYIWVHDNAVTNCGRHMVSVVCGSNILIEKNTMGTSGYGVFDIEPELASVAGIFNCTFRNNTITTYGINTFFSQDGVNAGKAISGVTISGNRVNNKSLNTRASDSVTVRPKNIVFTGNSSGVSAAGSVLVFAHTDGLTVTGNTQPLSSGSLVSATDCTAAVITPNP